MRPSDDPQYPPTDPPNYTENPRLVTHPQELAEQLATGEKVWGYYEGAVRPVTPTPKKKKYVVVTTKDGVEFFMCLWCGTLVMTQLRHNKWHKKLAAAIAAARNSPEGVTYYG